MTEIVNLRRLRKRRERTDRAKVAEVNRAVFGRPKAERQRSEKQTELETTRLAGHWLDDTPGDER
ncbi:MAG: DUF4169 family protein [Alphaproteobacteria bacterium]|nr:DUF4169 family protein [Alphaproteobacteria bacterium]